MNRNFVLRNLPSLLLIAPSLCLGETMRVPYNPDASDGSTIETIDSLEFFSIFNDAFAPSSVFIDGQTLNEYIKVLESISDTVPSDAGMVPMIDGMEAVKMLLWEGEN